MKHINTDAMLVLAEICMEKNEGDAVQSYNDIKEIDDLLGILKAKTLINHTKGRRPNREKRYNDVFRARIAAGYDCRMQSKDVSL